MEEDFPRGSISARSTRLGDQKRRSFVQLGEKRAIDDVLFKDSEQETPSKGKKKKKTKKTDSGETEESKLDEELTETEGALPKPLTAKTITEGMLVLAVIQEIHEYEIVLSLPNGLTAFVQITDVSSFFTRQLQELNESSSADDQDLPNIQDLYQVGNLVPCKIKSLSSSKDGHWRIQASLDYKEINSELGLFSIKQGMTLHGCVSSVEDHGYSIDLGIQGTNVFLSKADTAKGAQGRKGEVLKTGKLVTCVVKAVKSNGRSILLAIDRERLRSSKATKNTNTTLSSLQPGTKLDALVTKILPNSLIVDVFGLYKGCVDPVHLRDTADKPTKYEIGQKLTAVVIYNCPTTKSIGLSLNPVHQKTTFDPLVSDLSPGDIVEDALVLRVQEKESLIVQLNTKTRGIVYHSHGSDDKQKRYNPASVGEKVRCRILNFNVFDGLAIVSMRKSILDKPFLGINDVKPGMLVTGVIESVMPRGVAVKIQDRIHGFVPRTHLADIPVQKPQERFTIGSEIELRVLVVEPAKRRVLLTHKKTMVKSSQPIIASYTQPKVGMWVHGCVVAVKDFGCIVSFYNEVKGIIPRAELGMDESSLPMDNFFIGQVVKCRVMKTHDPEMKKLSLSLRQDGTRERDAFEAGKMLTSNTTKSSNHLPTASEGAYQVRRTEEPTEFNKMDFLEKGQDKPPEVGVTRMKEQMKAKKEGNTSIKKTWMIETQEDTASHSSYLQEITERLEAFASIMDDIKIVRVQMDGMKEMLEELTDKNRQREKVRDESFGDEQQETSGGKVETGKKRILWEEDYGDDGRDGMDGEKMRITEGRDLGEDGNGRVNVNIGNDEKSIGYDDISDDASSEGGYLSLGENEKVAVGVSESLGNGEQEKYNNDGGDEKPVHFDDTSDGECFGVNSEEIGAVNFDRGPESLSVGEDKIVDEGDDDHHHHHHHDGGVGGDDDDNKSVDLANVFGDDSSDDECLRFDAEEIGSQNVYGEPGAASDKEEGNATEEIVKEPRKDEEAVSDEVSSDESEKGNPEELKDWERLSGDELFCLYEGANSIGDFACSALRKLIGNDILRKSSCYGASPSDSRESNIQVIDQDILKYVFEVTLDLYGIDDSEFEKYHWKFVAQIDVFCRELFEKQQGESGRATEGEDRDSKECPRAEDEGRSEERVDRGVISVEEGGHQRYIMCDDRSFTEKRLAWSKSRGKKVLAPERLALKCSKYAKSLMKSMVSADILAASSCSGIATQGPWRPNVKMIDPEILDFVLRKTYVAFDVTETEYLRMHCVKSIDLLCSNLSRKQKTRQAQMSQEERTRAESSSNESDRKDDIDRDEDAESCSRSIRKGRGQDTHDTLTIQVPWKPLLEADVSKIMKRAKSLGNFAKLLIEKLVRPDILVKSSCSGKATQQRPNVQKINPEILKYVISTTCDSFCIIDEAKEKKVRRVCETAIDSHCRYLKKQTKRGKNLGNTSSPNDVEKSHERELDTAAVYTLQDIFEDDVEMEEQSLERAAEEHTQWKHLSDYDIRYIKERVTSKEHFATKALKKFLSPETLANSNCSGIRQHNSQIRNIQRIDPEILRYVLETTCKVYAVEEYEREEVHRDCRRVIDQHCRYMRKKFPQSVNKSCKIDEMRKHSDDDVKTFEGCKSVKRKKHEDDDDVKKLAQIVFGDGEGSASQDGIEDSQAHVSWKPLTEMEVNAVKSSSKWGANFATNAIRRLVSPDILVNSNCSGNSTDRSFRQNVKRIDPEILSYVLEKACEVYDIEESKRDDFHKECVSSINSHCRYLRRKLRNGLWMGKREGNDESDLAD